MKKLLLFLPSILTAQICPVAYPSVFTCIYQSGQTKAILAPYINPGSYHEGGNTYTWTGPSTAQMTGVNLATLTTNESGTYTLAIKNWHNPDCLTKSTHTVTVCDMVGLVEVGTEAPEILYFNLFNLSCDPKPGVVLIEQRGNVRRKVLINAYAE